MLAKIKEKGPGFQWNENQTGFIDPEPDFDQQNFWNEHLPVCHTRPNCQWFHQNGVIACRVCIFVGAGKCD